MTGYNLDAIRDKLKQMTKTGSSEKSELPKFKYFKPELGNVDIRFLPYKDEKGQPFQEVVYYQNKKLTEQRVVAPAQYGLEDPIASLEQEMRSDRSNESWEIRKCLNPTSRFYAPVIVRGREDEGIMLWEISSKLVQDIYATLCHEDYATENLMDPYSGYDWTVSAVDSGKKFNGFAVKEIKLQPRRKASPLFVNGKNADKARIEKILEEIPNLGEHFRKLVPGTEKLKTIIENFLNGPKDSEVDSEVSAGGVEHGTSGDGKTAATKSKIDSAFDDLENVF